MREIKFKAKRLDNGEWCEGYFYEENGNTYIIKNRQKESMLNRNVTHKVDPETVCQFTGLKDCEGKEVWEGDLIKFDKYDLYNRCVKVAKGVVEYRNGAFVAVTDGLHYSLGLKQKKVIGNKFDKEK